jgi:asparagine synthetase B (glutamine-hydrolysing)
MQRLGNAPTVIGVPSSTRYAIDLSYLQQLDHDLKRLPYRNLGRDDRIMANFGREVRYPFLDEGVIRFLSSLRADQKLSPGLTLEAPTGEAAVLGDKRLLRRLAMMIGLERAAKEKKRAVQFGSRSAKMEEGVKVKGHDRLIR